MLDNYDLTVVASPDLPDEYVMVAIDHPAARVLADGGAKPCGAEVIEPGQLPEIRFDYRQDKSSVVSYTGGQIGIESRPRSV